MNLQSNTRRRFIRASLAVPLLSKLPWTIPIANALPGDHFTVPENIQYELARLYGAQVNTIVNTDRLMLKAPDIAENGEVVPITVSGDKGLISSMAILVVNNPKPLVTMCSLHEDADLAVALRIRMTKTSDIYLVAQTQDGLVGVKRTVKVTVGCGGG